MMKAYQKGQVVDVDLGTPPYEVVGHEQAYERPCIIIKSFNSLGLAIIVPCTSKQPPNNIYTIVKIPKGFGGFTADSFVLCHQIRTISLDRVIRDRGKLDLKDILKVHAVLADMLEL